MIARPANAKDLAKPNYWVRQLSQPQGWVGQKLVAPFLDRYHARLQKLYFQQAAVRPHDHLLEIGFGSGKALTAFAQLATHGKVCGIELSADMIELARLQNRSLIETGRVELKQAGLDQIPYADQSFDKVLTANTIYYWPNPQANVGEMARVLKPGGQMLVAFRAPRINNIFTRTAGLNWVSPDELIDWMSKNGLSHIRCHKTLGLGLPGYCVSANKI